LRQCQSRLLFDFSQTQRAIGAHARENDADTLLLLILRQGAEEKIDRQAQPARRHGFEQVQHSVQDGHVLVRRDHINAVRANPGAVLDLKHLHAGAALEQFGHEPLPRRVQMLNNDKRHPASRGHARQELLQRLESPG